MTLSFQNYSLFNKLNNKYIDKDIKIFHIIHIIYKDNNSKYKIRIM